MNATFWNRMARSALSLTAGAALASLTQTGWSQDPPVPKPKPSPVAAPDETAKTRGDAKGEARDQVKGARDEARDTAKSAAKGARDTAEGAREVTQDARQAARETVQGARADFREARRDARRNFRSADFGLWFNGRAGATGLVIADVATQGGIAKVGFMEGDRIVSINGTPVTTEAEFTRFLSDESLGDQPAKIVVVRGGKEQTLSLQPSLLRQEAAAYDPLWQYGLVLDDSAKDRLVIQRVYPRTPAYYAGLRAGDTVVGIRGQRIAAIADLARALAQNADGLALQVSRGNQTRELEPESHANFDGEVRATLKPTIEPGRPGTPADQPPRLDGAPARPATPATPATPAVPPRPGAPAAPATPAIPATPAVPATPPAPRAPAPPATPAIP